MEALSNRFRLPSTSDRAIIRHHYKEIYARKIGRRLARLLTVLDEGKRATSISRLEFNGLAQQYQVDPDHWNLAWEIFCAKVGREAYPEN